MPRLGQNRLQRLASCITGDQTGGPFDYRRHADLENFFKRFTRTPIWTDTGDPDWEDEAGRYARTMNFLGACNNTMPGAVGLPMGIEDVIHEMLDLGEFEDESARDSAVREVQKILDGYRLTVDVAPDGQVRLASNVWSKHQQVIDKELHTAVGDILHESDLKAARLHYANARRMLGTDDFPNAAKEAVASVEACLSSLTGENDLRKALRKATAAGLPKPLDGVIEKLYAWRGNETGIAHGSKDMPSVTRADAQFAVNMAASVNLYLRDRLLTDAPKEKKEGLILF
jgi:hypothetical protein